MLSEDGDLPFDKKKEGKVKDELNPCPFCGRADIGIKDNILEYNAGQDCPCSSIRKVWAYCRYCGCEGRKKTIECVYDTEIIAAATEAWNRKPRNEA